MLRLKRVKKDMMSPICYQQSIKIEIKLWTYVLSADIDTADTHLLMSLKQLQHASNGWITIQIAAQTNAIGQAITRMIIQNKA